jgi:hypothetical protein
MAEERERAGCRELAAGLRVIDKAYRGGRLSDKEIALGKAAQKWGREEWKPRVLRDNPLALLLEPVFKDGSVAAAKAFALDCLCLALVLWPEGGASAPGADTNPGSR